ncbi:MAG: hypothetical protein A2X08_06945 [Bacteroidetes bacterium GWA2_32_17]|nr:MAG: hypothetical protein A2X08_06945 [Bacteroidetes bacterium GWA2_32_17]
MKRLYYYISLLTIILISFRIYSSVFYPGLNSDNAVTILMTHYFHLPGDLYFWGQDRMGSIIPLIAQIPNKVFHISAIYSEAITHYFLLIIGFFAISTFFKSYFVKFLFALIWFLPPEREIDITQLTLSIQYVFLFIGIYLISKLNRENHQINFKQHVFLLLAVFSMIIAIWDSDLAMVSIGIFILLHFYFLILDNSIKSIFKLADLYYLIFGIIVGSIFIIYAKSTSTIRNDYSLISKPNEIIESLNIFFKTLSDIFLFKLNERFTSIYSYLALFSIVLVCLFWKKVRFTDKLTKRIFLFFLLDLIIVFVIIIITKWTYLNGVPRRYFNCTYISATIIILLLFENINISKIKFYFVKYTLLITVLIGSFGTIYTLKYVWFPSFKPYSEYVAELKKLGKAGIIAEYWNSYIYSVMNPDDIKTTSHDGAYVRNRQMIDEVFKQDNIYLIKDCWLTSFPDTIEQFGRTLVKQGSPFNLANANLCRYNISSN